MAFRHTPYDGSKRPFTVGLEPVDFSCWLDPDSYLVAHLKRKIELLETAHTQVFRAESGTEEAQREVLDLILGDLAAHHTSTHSVSSDAVEVLDGGPNVRLADYAPLEAASRLVQEDLVLMRKGQDGYRLAAASLCFPSSWSLAEKFGQSMHSIHDNVPGFNDGRMGQVVARIFDNLTSEQLVGRYNWSIYDDPDLHHPQAKRLAPQIEEKGAGALAHLFVRVERQTLRRLPMSGDILFTIKIHHDPVSLLKTHERGAELAAGLAAQLRDLDERQIAYKGLTRYRAAIAEELENLAPSAPEAV